MNFFIFFCSQKVTMLTPEIFTCTSIPYTWIYTPVYLGVSLIVRVPLRSTYPGIMYGSTRENLRREHGHFL